MHFQFRDAAGYGIQLIMYNMMTVVVQNSTCFCSVHVFQTVIKQMQCVAEIQLCTVQQSQWQQQQQQTATVLVTTFNAF